MARTNYNISTGKIEAGADHKSPWDISYTIPLVLTKWEKRGGRTCTLDAAAGYWLLSFIPRGIKTK